MLGAVADLLKAILSLPVPELLMLSGLIFLTIAVLGKVSGKIEPDRNGRIAAAGLGTTLLAAGLVMWITAPPAPHSPTEAPTVAPTPVPTGMCMDMPSGTFGMIWSMEAGVRDSLGCARSASFGFAGVEQPFQNGHMVYRVDKRSIIVLLADTTRPAHPVGFWEEHQDQFREGADVEPPYQGAPAPAGLLVPVRGFGKLWREDGRIQQKLGFASGVELGFDGSEQTFDYGRMMLTGTGNPPSPTTWVLNSNGGYRRISVSQP